jgi:hypothetical protein
VVGTQDTIVILCANYPYLIVSGFFLAALGQKWYPVCQLLFKDHILLLILAQMRWHTGFQSAPLRIQSWNPVQSRDAPDTVLAGYRISGLTSRLLVKYNKPAISKGQIYECFYFETLKGAMFFWPKPNFNALMKI